MGLGDLLNFDYGYDAGGTPLWDFGTSGYSLGGPVLTSADILGDQFGNGSMRGADFSLGVNGIDDMPMRASVFEPTDNGLQPIGYRGVDGTVQTLEGNPIETNPFGINRAPGQAGASLRDLLKNLARAGGGLDAPGGGGAAMPRIDSPIADRITAHPVPALQTGAITAPPAPAEPRVVFQPVPVPQGEGGLARLMGERDPFADVKQRLYGGR